VWNAPRSNITLKAASYNRSSTNRREYLQLHVGCSGWNHEAWLGHFYPSYLPNAKWLEHYSSVFDYVEIDSTFYKIPRREMPIRWVSNTPDNFRFTAKFPQVVTHDTRLGGGFQGLEKYFNSLRPLDRKILCLLMELPSSLKKDEGLPKLERLIPNLWKKYRYAIEVRHHSWFHKDVYEFLQQHDVCLAWSQSDTLQSPPEITTDFIYLRFTSERSVNDKDIGSAQKDKEIARWARLVKNVPSRVRFGIVVADDKYAGFGPATANMFKKYLV
jgi:uncharacterized protein YecE (DUF72 family)